MSATTSTATTGLALSGLASGLDWTSIVNEMLQMEAAPETQMQTQETADQNKNSAYQTIGTDLTTLNKDIQTLSHPSFFQSRATSLSNSLVASATASSGTPLGNYTFNITKLASDSMQEGAEASAPLSSSNNVSSLVLSSAGFATPVTAGTFTVNGQAITISTSDTLQSVFDQISTATGGAVTAAYNSTSDEITLTGTGPITLGSDTDTSNFLQASELYNNGSDTISSASSLGGVNLNSTVADANFSTALTAASGQFKINGVAINYSSTDTISDVLQSINGSAAGVTATYDSVNNRFDLTDTTTGNVGISLQDVTGNFLAASGISGGTLVAGNNLQYSINGGGTLTSQSNTVDAGTSGITGLSFTALSEGITTVSVSTDTNTISSAISSFVTDYNAVQNYISSQTTTTTDPTTGAVTPGLLTGDLDAENIVSSLRQLVGASPGSTPGIESLNDLGITSNGTDNTLSFSDSTSLNAALTNNLSAVQSLFTDPTTGIATQVQSYINNTTSLNGVLSTDENNMTNEANSLATSIKSLQQKISNDQVKLDNEFTAMETAINTINTEKQYLNSYFSASSASDQSAPSAAGSSFGSSSSSSS
jgi:flagellar hook-associated protein 2